MPVIHIQTACLEGSRVLPVTVEVDIHPGLPVFSIIGLPDKRIEEAKERVRGALKNSGFAFPLGRITVNLAPSSVRKQGTGFDLAIALGILAADGKIRSPSDVWVLGELSLNGAVQPCQHLVPLLVEAVNCGIVCIIPESQAELAALVQTVSVVPFPDLKTAIHTITGGNIAPVRTIYKQTKKPLRDRYLLDGIVAQESAKRALTIALAGGHNLMLSGPPGVGKTMLAQAAKELLPPLGRSELLTLAQLYSFAGIHFSLHDLQPPLRVPLPSVSKTSLIGGGTPVKPGEMSLAHAGILFLDEFAEMERSVRDSLRIPLQEKSISIARSNLNYHFPARCIVIAAHNNCPCGLLGVAGESCQCSVSALTRYQNALSEPILDRFDLFCTLTKPTGIEWNTETQQRGEVLARAIARARKLPKLPVSDAARSLLNRSVDQLKLSGRGKVSVEKVASTVAKLAGKTEVLPEHVQEALQYRRRV